MAFIDVFNGDADGICALTQLRLANPCASTLVTGVKRDIELLERVQAGAGDSVTVLDVSLDKNRDGVQRLLAAGAEVFYVDHHFAGEQPSHPGFTAIINEAADVCTSLLVNGHLKNRFAAWAVVGAFGDNLNKSAEIIAKSLQLEESQLRQLESLGTYMNYNGYGEKVEDLLFTPEELFRLVSRHSSPLEFIQEGREHYTRLAEGYEADMSKASAMRPESETETAALIILPNQAWARRVGGVYSNDLTNQHPGRAHAVLTEKASGSYLVSVRAPLSNKKGADELCRRFPTGGGRAAAAGINDLPAGLLPEFWQQFQSQYARS